MASDRNLQEASDVPIEDVCVWKHQSPSADGVVPTFSLSTQSTNNKLSRHLTSTLVTSKTAILTLLIKLNNLMVHQWQVIDLFCHKKNRHGVEIQLENMLHKHRTAYKRSHFVWKTKESIETIACPFTEKQKLYIKKDTKNTMTLLKTMLTSDCL